MVSSVVIAADRVKAISGSKDKTIREWNLETEQELKVLTGHGDTIRKVLIINDGRTVISASWDKTLKIWDLQTGALIKTINIYNDRVMAIAVTSDEKRVITASWDKNLQVWDLKTGQCLASFRGDCAFWACAISPDNKTVVTGGQGGTVHFFNLIDNYRLKQIKKNSYEPSNS